jgi:hypothetical protein
VVDPPRPGPRDYATALSVLGLLALGYVLYPDPRVQYGVWLAIFTIWMAWFVSYGVEWLFPDGE